MYSKQICANWQMQMKASDLTFQFDCTPAQFQQLIKLSVYLAFLSLMGAFYFGREKFPA